MQLSTTGRAEPQHQSWRRSCWDSWAALAWIRQKKLLRSFLSNQGEQLGYLPWNNIPKSQYPILRWLFSQLHPFGWRRFPWSLIKVVSVCPTIKPSCTTQVVKDESEISCVSQTASLINLTLVLEIHVFAAHATVTNSSICGSCHGQVCLFAAHAAVWAKSQVKLRDPSQDLRRWCTGSALKTSVWIIHAQ